MPGKSKRLKLVLTPQEVQHLQRLRASRTAPVREVQRAEILSLSFRRDDRRDYASGQDDAQKRRQMDQPSPRHRRGSSAQGCLSSSTGRPASPPMPRPGWCIWPAANPPNSVTPPSCGPAARSLYTCAGMPWKRAIRPWPKRLRRPYIVFWPSNLCIRRR